VIYHLDYALATDMYFANKFCNWENIECPITTVLPNAKKNEKE